MTISVCMIVKDEETVLARCLDCLCSIGDEFIIVDTGSSDHTKEIAHKYTDKVYDYQWTGNFSEARNFAFSKATQDYIYSADADELIDIENQNKFMLLKRALLPEIELVQMKYANQLQFNTIYNFDMEYRPKLFKRLRTFQWIDFIHETINISAVCFDSDIVITHMPVKNHTKRDFSIFTGYINSGYKLSKRLHLLYARELYIAGTDSDFMEAQSYFNETMNDENRSLDEIRASQCVLARCNRIKNDDISFFKIALKNMIGKPSAEVCVELGEYFYAKEDFEEAAFWFYTAAYGAECELNIHYGGDLTLKRIADCYIKIGNTEEAEKYNNLAQQWTIPSLADKGSLSQ